MTHSIFSTNIILFLFLYFYSLRFYSWRTGIDGNPERTTLITLLLQERDRHLAGANQNTPAARSAFRYKHTAMVQCFASPGVIPIKSTREGSPARSKPRDHRGTLVLLFDIGDKLFAILKSLIILLIFRFWTKIKKHIQDLLRLSLYIMTCLWPQQLLCYSTILYCTVLYD